jgi:hypothetical protein
VKAALVLCVYIYIYTHTRAQIYVQGFKYSEGSALALEDPLDALNALLKDVKPDERDNFSMAND